MNEPNEGNSPYISALLTAANCLKSAMTSVRKPDLQRALQTSYELVIGTIDAICLKKDFVAETRLKPEDRLVEELAPKACKCDSDIILPEDRDPSPEEFANAKLAEGF
jgi:hypothetical protein